MRVARKFRYDFFAEMGKSRFKRIIMCIFVIANAWVLADVVSDNFEFKINLWHDLICVLTGVIMERIIPWGKDESAQMKVLRRDNYQLLKALKKANNILEHLADEREKQKEV